MVPGQKVKVLEGTDLGNLRSRSEVVPETENTQKGAQWLTAIIPGAQGAAAGL